MEQDQLLLLPEQFYYMESIKMKPIIKFVNVETGEEIEREMNDAEFAQYEKDAAEGAQAQAETQAKAQAKAALLERLGITEEEAKLLLG
jgi:hypothetical protein